MPSLRPVCLLYFRQRKNPVQNSYAIGHHLACFIRNNNIAISTCSLHTSALLCRDLNDDETTVPTSRKKVSSNSKTNIQELPDKEKVLNDENHKKKSLENIDTKKQPKQSSSTLWQSLVESQVDSPALPNKEQRNLEITSMKNLKPTFQKGTSEKDTMQLIMDVVAELNPDKGSFATRKRERLQLSKKVKEIRNHTVAESPRYFESMLGDLKHSHFSKRGMPQAFQQERNTKPHMNVNFSKGNNFFVYEVMDSKEQVKKEQSTWSAMDWYEHYKSENDAKMSNNHDKYFPCSAYDEMIRWTKEGKLWKFPINNEDGMDVEADTPFHKHVFLEDKLNEGDWCPKSGPIRQFMISVITALSNNPFISVQDKHEHIEWFRDYFIERLEALKKLGLIEQEQSVSQMNS